MASALTSPLGIFALVLLIIGVIMTIIGIIFIIARQNQTKEWWIWTLLIGGLVLAIFGGILMAVALATREQEQAATPPAIAVTPAVAPTPVPLANPCGYDYIPDNFGRLPPPRPAPAPPARCPPPAYNYDIYNRMNRPYDYYAGAPVVSQPAPHQITTPPAAGNYTNINKIGTDRFDPDPQAVTERIERSPQRVLATGPYGPDGQMTTVSGTFTPAPLEVDRTYDVPDHNVRVVGGNVGYNYGVR